MRKEKNRSLIGDIAHQGVWQKDFFLILGCIVALALLLRGIVCWQLYGTETVMCPSSSTDMASYHRLALEIRNGHWPLFYDYQPFYYAILLPLLFVFSPSGAVWLVLVMHSLLGGAAVYLSGLCAAKMWGRRAGIFAALLLALSRFHIFYTPFMLYEVLQSFWMALILYLALLAIVRNRWKNWLILGAVCGVSTLTRGNALLFMPGFIVLCLYMNRRDFKRGLLYIVLMGVIFYLPQLPFAMRNYQYFGEWRGPSVAQNKVLALGNTPEAPPGGLEYPPSYHLWVAQADDAPAGQRVSILANIAKWVAREPWAWPELKIRSVLLFWDKTEIPNNVSIEVQGRHSSLLQWPCLLNFSVIGAIGLAGCFLLLGHLSRKYNLVLLYMIAAYWFGTSGFYVLARFRIGALPLICIAGGYAIERLWSAGSRWYAMRKMPGARPLAPVLKVTWAWLFAIFMVNCSFGLYQEWIEVPVMQHCRPNGLVLEFPGYTTIYDHGPLAFGGCEIYQFNQAVALKKSFALPESKAGKTGEFRLWYWGNEQLIKQITVMADGKILTQPKYENNYLIWQLSELPATEKIEFAVIVPASFKYPAALNFDLLRRYQRTELDGEIMPAELVAELKIFDD